MTHRPFLNRVWTLRAACTPADTDRFYPEVGAATEPAKRVCRRCPVTAECLAYALARNERYGVWGGLSERERRQFRRAS